MTASYISSAPKTRTVSPMPAGRAVCACPQTSDTSAPAARQARAKAAPICPLDRLVMPRTGSMASKVAPSVINTRLPDRLFSVHKSGNRSASSAASGIRPVPVSPQACSPSAGGKTVMPSASSCAMLRWLAGLPHISTFMAGATANGHLRAAARLVKRLSAMPLAIFASVLAEAGAIRKTSASRVRLMCAMPLPSPA